MLGVARSLGGINLRKGQIQSSALGGRELRAKDKATSELFHSRRGGEYGSRVAHLLLCLLAYLQASFRGKGSQNADCQLVVFWSQGIPQVPHSAHLHLSAGLVNTGRIEEVLISSISPHLLQRG